MFPALQADSLPTELGGKHFLDYWLSLINSDQFVHIFILADSVLEDYMFLGIYYFIFCIVQLVDV